MKLTEQQVDGIISGVISYMQQEHDRYLPSSVPLRPELKAPIRAYFPGKILDGVRAAASSSRSARPAQSALHPEPS